MNKTLVYLACPYSHADHHVRRLRFGVANVVAARMMQQGIHVFSPISHTHPIAEVGDLPKDWQFWKEYDLTFTQICRMLVVIKLDGWQESVGVQAEIKYANDLGIPIEYVEP
jgi:hypothetical protein